MTTLAEPLAPLASPNEPPPHSTPAAHPSPSRFDFPVISEAWILARALARAGFPCSIAIGNNPPTQSTVTPLFALHLRHPVPAKTLLNALVSLRSKKMPALLLLSNTPRSQPYREYLHLSPDHHVLGIRRKFRQLTAASSQKKLVGVAWKIAGPLSSLPRPTPGPCWKSARALSRLLPAPLPRITLPTENSPDLHTLHNYFIGPKTHHRPLYAFLKRAFDIAFSTLALLATLPICLVVAALIKLHDKGPIFFIHKREGKNAQPFPCLKFRTMTQNADALQSTLRHSNQLDGPQFKMTNDPRITPIGHFLRKTNIDELPQFLNVLAGHMSVVGPRPSPFKENQLCPAWREARLSIKPGITGLWQISRSKTRGTTDFQEWILYDTQYVDRRSLLLDTRIILLTLKELLGQGQ